MRDGEPLHHARGALGLAGQEGVHHGVGVAGDTGLDSLVGNEAQSLVTRSEVLGDKDVLDLTKSAASALGASTAAPWRPRPAEQQRRERPSGSSRSRTS